MENINQKTLICQSCGMPMVKPGELGSNIDGSKNEEYCFYCFQKGRFTQPDLTLNLMIEKLISMHTQMNLSEEEAREIANKNLPKLRRWIK